MKHPCATSQSLWQDPHMPLVGVGVGAHGCRLDPTMRTSWRRKGQYHTEGLPLGGTHPWGPLELSCDHWAPLSCCCLQTALQRHPEQGGLHTCLNTQQHGCPWA